MADRVWVSRDKKVYDDVAQDTDYEFWKGGPPIKSDHDDGDVTYNGGEGSIMLRYLCAYAFERVCDFRLEPGHCVEVSVNVVPVTSSSSASVSDYSTTPSARPVYDEHDVAERCEDPHRLLLSMELMDFDVDEARPAVLARATEEVAVAYEWVAREILRANDNDDVVRFECPAWLAALPRVKVPNEA